MKTLIVMRHAKAADGSPDRTRPLADRGKRQAAQVGGELNRLVGQVDQLFVSDATRTFQTLESLIQGGLQVAETSVDGRLYTGGGDEQVEIVRTEATGQTVMVVGHEPMMSAVAFQLWDREGDAGFESGFPTAGAAVFTFDGDWYDIPGRMHLSHFVRSSH